MSVILYRCEEPGTVEKIQGSECEDEFPFSKFCIVYKYDCLYNSEISRFNGADTPYALPGKNKKMKLYNGFDRKPLHFTPDDEENCSKSKEAMEAYFKTIGERSMLEMIFIRITGSDDTVPTGMEFLGFDVCYTPDSDGFSAICDCMFLCRWHGCDQNGTEFTEEFERLNENGLFDSKEDAVKYLYHYLSQDWAETGDFCILEIYR